MTLPLVVTTRTAAETRAVACAIAALLDPGDVLLLAGDLGAGKTTFAKGLAEGLGVEGPVVSPTFTLAREYEGRRLRMVHADVFRLDRGSEVLDLGLEDLAGDDGVTVVEWGDRAVAFVPGEHLVISMETLDDDARRVTFDPRARSWHERGDALSAAIAAACPGGVAC